MAIPAATGNIWMPADWQRVRVSDSLGYTRGMTKRGYSRDFKPHGDTGKRYLLDKIPAGLWSDVKAKAKRDGISVRALILKLLTEWIASR
jgi:hypothetical protein